jgi:hypothetical protein
MINLRNLLTVKSLSDVYAIILNLNAKLVFFIGEMILFDVWKVVFIVKNGINICWSLISAV